MWRACIMGNFEAQDPTQSVWTARAETSPPFVALMLSHLRDWAISKHDVKGAFLAAPILDGELGIIIPSALWIQWGLVKPNVL